MISGFQKQYPEAKFRSSYYNVFVIAKLVLDVTYRKQLNL